ncbi:MAG TPA: hypothetical protein VNH46_08800, partial [Gemmatimonadales bacterium]|nr:hypothetical protein [Gemmatimonadales bacterium]
IRRGLAWLPLLGAALLAAPRALAAQTDSAEKVLVELRLGRIAARTVEAWRVGDTALVPLDAFADLAELRFSRLPDSTMETMLQPGNVPLVLDPASRSLRLGKRTMQLGPTQLIVAGGRPFVAVDVLGRAMQLEFAVSWPDLQVAVLDPSTLPVARRLRREAYLESRLAQSEVPEVTRLDLGLNRSRVDGLILDYSALTPTTGLDGGAYAGALGFDVLGGSLGLGLQSQSGTGRGPRTDLSWTGIWRENPYLAQLRLGDGVATGPAARNLRGVSLSNSPYVRPAVLGDVGFGGQLGPGWTVEAYRGGRLIGFDSVNALGQFSFDVPVQYGENPVDFVAYGPFGEVREFGQTYRMRTDGLPARRFEYGLSAGQCRTGRCAATGNLDLRYGLSTRWTVRGGLDQFWRDSLGNLTHPYVGVLGALSNAVTVEAQAVADAVLHGVIRYEPSVNVSLQAEANRFARGVADPILTPAGRLSQWTLTGFLRPFGGFAGTYFDASLDRIHGTSADITSGRLGASLQAAGVRFLPAVRLQQTSAPGGGSSTQTFYGVNAFLLPHPELGRVLGTVSARSAFE